MTKKPGKMKAQAIIRAHFKGSDTDHILMIFNITLPIFNTIIENEDKKISLKKLSCSQREQMVVKDYKEGKRITDIMNLYGIGSPAMYIILKKNNIELRIPRTEKTRIRTEQRKSMSVEKKEALKKKKEKIAKEAIEAYLNRMPTSLILEKFNLNTKSFLAIRKEYRIKKRKRAGISARGKTEWDYCKELAVFECLNTSATQKDVAKRYGVTRQAVNWWVKAHKGTTEQK